MASHSKKQNICDSANGSKSAPAETPHSAASAINGWPAEPKRVLEQPAFAQSASARQPSPHSAREGWMNRITSRSVAQTVSANELTSLSALIAYAAHKTGVSEFRIERDLADRFAIANITCLPAERFDDALRYLVDQVPSQAA